MKKLCEICQRNEGVVSAIIYGKYHKNVCGPCKLAGVSVSSGHARWNRSIDAEDHEGEIQQPYQSDGSPNPKFIRLYPAQAKSIFTSDQIRKASL